MREREGARDIEALGSCSIVYRGLMGGRGIRNSASEMQVKQADWSGYSWKASRTTLVLWQLESARGYWKVKPEVSARSTPRCRATSPAPVGSRLRCSLVAGFQAGKHCDQMSPALRVPVKAIHVHAWGRGVCVG